MTWGGTLSGQPALSIDPWYASQGVQFTPIWDREQPGPGGRAGTVDVGPAGCGGGGDDRVPFEAEAADVAADRFGVRWLATAFQDGRFCVRRLVRLEDRDPATPNRPLLALRT